MQQVAYYGLPAAAILCLALLNNSVVIVISELSLAKVVQDLSVLVAQVENGCVVHVEEPNYALLAGATRTIKNLLDRVLSGTMRDEFSQGDREPPLLTSSIGEELDWMPWAAEGDPWDFESGFWENLAEHPALGGMSSNGAGVLW